MTDTSTPHVDEDEVRDDPADRAGADDAADDGALGVDPRAEADEDEDEGDDEEDDDEEDEEEADEEAGGTGSAKADETDLFRQSEIAADYVEGLLDVLDYDGDIDELISGGRPVVEVVGGRLQSLVGQRGATLEALQELTRLAVFRQTGTPSRLLLDVGGYRAARRKELAAVAKNAVEKVKEFGEPVRLEPMSAFERKCVHDVVNAIDGVQSESEGVEPQRRIVVHPVAD
ncbi:Jag family protein [Rhizomonospora bruguierae]|uniref:Jag family protein n=1 Tax=Rhizomonospora bruguierae TaxID=1581705 RepID=UPI001BD14A4C|nr:R3H domain-containing nucleic acid-binding protein [Micromonospora sp. NBRC 107566]